MVSTVRSTQGQLPSGDSNVSKKALHTCAFFINFLGYTVSMLTNVLSQNEYFLAVTCVVVCVAVVLEKFQLAKV